MSQSARLRLEQSVRDDDRVQEYISSANMFYPLGTHRSPQCKEGNRTPGPGSYRVPSSFPSLRHREFHAGKVRRKAPSWSLSARSNNRVMDIGNPFNIMPPVAALFKATTTGSAANTTLIAPSGKSVNSMPPCGPSGVILKGHGGDRPRGWGPPY